MRKIISILIALGLILGLSVMAMPATAQTCTAGVSLSNPCANATSNYTINFTIPVTLTPGNDRLSVKFADGTSLAGVTAAKVSLNGTSPTSINKTGSYMDFPVPNITTGLIFAGTFLELIIRDVVNPSEGSKTLILDYKLVCCPAVDFCTGTYTIRPRMARYSCLVDFNDTYPGIAVDFVPPFKACGQNSTGRDFITWYNSTTNAWFSPFDLNLIVTPGCEAPCANASLFVRMTAADPATVRATFNITGTFYTLNSTNNITLANAFVMNATGNSSLQMALHFNEAGKYKIYFKVFCPGGTTWSGTCPDCIPPGAEILICEKTYDFTVHQWKDAFKLTLEEKWNLISLPLVPLTADGKIAVADALASIPAAVRANIVSIWHYDRCADRWFVWPTPGAGQTALTHLEAGDAYWVRVRYPLTPACSSIGWWVWGTEKPVPPASPAEYRVCRGWNMFGFLRTTPLAMTGAGGYLWNWPSVVVYEWSGGPCWYDKNWNLVTTGTPGSGYWGAFPADGAIYVP